MITTHPITRDLSILVHADSIMFSAEQLEALSRQGFDSGIWDEIDDPVQEQTTILKKGRLSCDENGNTVVVRGGNVYDSNTDSVQVVDVDEVWTLSKMNYVICPRHFIRSKTCLK